VQPDADGIGQKRLPKKREWAEPNTPGFHARETAVTDETIELTRIVAFRLKR
jgi:hypothetical protein